MEIDFIWLALGIAIAGYFVGDGLKNFKSPSKNNIFDLLDDDDDHELIKASEVHHFIGVSKEDASKLIEEYEDVPHIILNDTVYYPKASLREWLLQVGKKND